MRFNNEMKIPNQFHIIRYFGFTILFLFGFIGLPAHAQKMSDADIAKLIQSFKTQDRGPYRDIRWFCPDGSTLPAQERCLEPGGVQRARYKAEVEKLAQTNHIFLGQILSTTDFAAFWDKPNHFSRLKQYQIEQFLKANDNGWVNQKAQFYRGASQIEDEENWGINFFTWLLEQNEFVEDEFFLIRQSAKDIPHAAETNTSLLVRSLSKEIADEYSAFMNLRIKIHGQPEAADIAKVKEFKRNNNTKLTSELNTKLDDLVLNMEKLYAPIDVSSFRPYVRSLSRSARGSALINTFIEEYPGATTQEKRTELIAETATELREVIAERLSGSARLAIIDASNKLETLLNKEASEWAPKTLREQMAKTMLLTKAAYGFGYLEQWEWAELAKTMLWQSNQIRLKELGNYADFSRKAVEWGTGMIRANYLPTVRTFQNFEPLAEGFIDEKVRGSVLLHLGRSASMLGDYFSMQAGFSNAVMKIPDQSSIRGLNPGYAMGELVVTTESPENIEVSSDKIYVFDMPPADLKPVAGIATVSEGNLVSHVQLLARNLGIPNAVLSAENLNSLLQFNGQEVFYAVSNKGTVILKLASNMTATEKALFEKRARSEQKISVPVETMQLSDPKILNMRNVDASYSGKVCGPKAANLGQLKQMFPENVVEGIVIPFSIFKQHFDQTIPGEQRSYWEFLKSIFSRAEQMQSNSIDDAEIEVFVLAELEKLREVIKKMPLMPEFERELRQNFREVFGGVLGQVPVFIRSDTNMEDLKDFTGAGLNLTLFNVLDQNKILQGIKDVWASPYTERSYKWRQKYLLNPENVFPSILIIPSVNADASGVLITKGLSNGNLNEVTVAFNRGVGGAVEGQSSETWALKPTGVNQLLSPAREPEFTSIPVTGGTVKVYTNFSERVLSEENLKSLRSMSKELLTKLPQANILGPYDVELGFKDDKIWLFQVRPFVENKQAASSEFLRSITPALAETLVIPLNAKL